MDWKKIQTVRLHNAKTDKQAGERQQGAHRVKEANRNVPHKLNYIKKKHKRTVYINHQTLEHKQTYVRNTINMNHLKH